MRPVPVRENWRGLVSAVSSSEGLLSLAGRYQATTLTLDLFHRIVHAETEDHFDDPEIMNPGETEQSA